MRLTIKNVSSLGGKPQYPRLSEVIDVVSARIEGRDAIIDIKTMGDFDISHSSNSDRDRISVAVNSAPKTNIPPSAMPKRWPCRKTSATVQTGIPCAFGESSGSKSPQEQPSAQTAPPSQMPLPASEEEQLEAKALPETTTAGTSGLEANAVNDDKQPRAICRFG